MQFQAIGIFTPKRRIPNLMSMILFQTGSWFPSRFRESFSTDSFLRHFFFLVKKSDVIHQKQKNARSFSNRIPSFQESYLTTKKTCTKNPDDLSSSSLRPENLDGRGECGVQSFGRWMVFSHQISPPEKLMVGR